MKNLQIQESYSSGLWSYSVIASSESSAGSRINGFSSAAKTEQFKATFSEGDYI